MVNNIALYEENEEFNRAVDFIRSSDKLVYLTGKLGTDKTTFLKHIKLTTEKNTMIVAATGLAAANVGGVTIRSFFNIPSGPFLPNDLRLRTEISKNDEDERTIYSTFQYRRGTLEIIKNLELLIIDEVSMLRVDTLDVIDTILSVFRNKQDLPFGGVQVILIGGAFQLPPIADDNEWNILSRFYKTRFFFSAKVIEQNPSIDIELKKIYRQENNVAFKENNIVLEGDDIEFEEGNVEFNRAVDFIRYHTDKIVYLTGKAGTGKTTFLKYIKRNTKKNTVIVAPTGVAALNAGGVTIHSFFKIPLGPLPPDDPRLRTEISENDEDKRTIYSTFRYRKGALEIIKNLELLIIDEVSMLRADVLDVIDKILRAFRKQDLFFGGVQVILIGDPFQLPPIANDNEWNILSRFYKTHFFFSAKVIEQNPPIYIELKKIYRQHEQEFIDLLNRVRVNEITQEDLQKLNSKYDPACSDNGSEYIILATHNKIVEETNRMKLDQLETELFTFEATLTGDFSCKPTDELLKMKVEAQVMFLRNDNTGRKRYFNGKIGKIKELEKDSIRLIFDDGSEVKVKRSVWHNIRYVWDEKEKKIKKEEIGTFEQFPIRLAWAITVHKGQGLTFKKVIVDLEKAFDAGQVYVALSRCTSFDGLKLKTRLNRNAIKTNPKVLEFAKKNETSKNQ